MGKHGWVTGCKGLMVLWAGMAWADVCPVTVEVPCGDGAAYEVKVDTGRFPVPVSDPYFTGTVTATRMRRLVLPTDPANPRHLAVFETDGLPKLGGASFSVKTSLGTVTGRLGAGRFVAVEATKGIAPFGPPAAAGDRVFACYWLEASGGRQSINWVDQFGAHDGTVGRPTYACFPAGGSATDSFVAFGQARDTGSMGLSVIVDTGFTGALGPMHVDPLDEFWAVVVP